jgi:hypothetical protein
VISTALVLAAPVALPVAQTVNASPVFALDVLTVARLLGVAVPLLVAVLAKSTAPRWLKSVSNFALTIVVGVVAPIIAGEGAPANFSEFFNSLINAFVVNIVAYYGLLKPAGVTGAIQRATQNFGVGSANPNQGVGSSSNN